MTRSNRRAAAVAQEQAGSETENTAEYAEPDLDLVDGGPVISTEDIPKVEAAVRKMFDTSGILPEGSKLESFEVQYSRCQVALPIFTGDVNGEEHGYISTRVDINLMGVQAERMKQLIIGLRQSHVMYNHCGQMRHVDTPADMIRWLLTMVDSFVKLEEAGQS